MPTLTFLINPHRAEAADLAAETASWLRSLGHETAVSTAGGPIGSADEEAVLARSAVAISLGGDGTMLRAVDSATRHGIPVLGVNLGSLGYLTEVEPGALKASLERFLAGDFGVEERMTLSVVAEGPAPERQSIVGPLLALNEAVLEKTVPGHTVHVAASIGGKPFVTYAADGVLAATPTGSTAYNLSARGPIVSPQLRAIVLTPISPHMLFDRPLVLDPAEWLRLEVLGPRPGVLVVDGTTVAELPAGATVTCRAGERPARLVTFGERDFHAILRAKFQLADR